MHDYYYLIAEENPKEPKLAEATRRVRAIFDFALISRENRGSALSREFNRLNLRDGRLSGDNS